MAPNNQIIAQLDATEAALRDALRECAKTRRMVEQGVQVTKMRPVDPEAKNRRKQRLLKQH